MIAGRPEQLLMVLIAEAALGYPAWLLARIGHPVMWVGRMIGHRDARYRQLDWASARLDDGLNWGPARIAGVLICLAGGSGWRILWRDAGDHLSPNAGWPESGMAGAPGVRLGGGAAYDGEWIARETLGDGSAPGVVDLTRAMSIYRRACALLWLTIGGTAWLL